MTQAEAIARVNELGLHGLFDDPKRCTGDASTCPVDECFVCSVRDCPSEEPLHYDKDGCPACSEFRGPTPV